MEQPIKIVDEHGNMIPTTPEQQSEVEQFNSTPQGQIEQAIAAARRFGDQGIRSRYY